MKNTLPVILTLCIPTYNRVSLLEAGIARIAKEMPGLPMEVCVSDNGSADNTPDLLRELATRHPWLRFRLSSENRGIDANMESVVRMARGRYIWQLGDDDLVVPGAITRLVGDLERDPVDLLILQGRFIDPSGKMLGPYLAAELQSRCFENLRDAFSSVWRRLKYGTFIVAREAILGDWQRYGGTHHAYGGVIWDYFARESTAGRPILIRTGDKEMVEICEAPKTYEAYRCRVLFVDLPRWFSLLPPAFKDDCVPILRSWFKSQSSFRSLQHHVRTGQLTWETRSELMQAFTAYQRLKAMFVLAVTGRKPPIPMLSF